MHHRLYSNIETRQVLKKSVFITRLLRLLKPEEIPAVIQQMWAEHPKASHVCYAYRSVNFEKVHDDGEPAKTAGYPMLQVLRQAHLVDVLAVVIRYYGGIPLGASGLTRAYRSSVALALTEATLSQLNPMFVIDVRVELENAHVFLGLVKDALILKQHYTDVLSIQIAVQDESAWHTLQQRYPKALHIINTSTQLIEQ